MYSFLKLRQLGAAIDVVMRTWARALRLRSEDVMLILLLGHRRQCAAELAQTCGRTRHHVHRNLHRLEKKKVLQPCLVSASGRVQQWGVTERGRRIFDVLEGQVRLWDTQVADAFELEAVMCALEQAMSALVGCPADPRGWEGGLREPRAVTEREVWAQEATQALLELAKEMAAELPVDVTPARAAAREAARLKAEQDESEAFEELRRKLWG